MKNSNKKNNEISVQIHKGIDFLLKLSKNQRDKLLVILKEVEAIQKSSLSTKEKAIALKSIMWSKRSIKSKLLIGGFLGALTGLFIFGTGGIGITALGGGIGIWGWLATSAGGVAISSIIQNFEKNKD